VFFLQLDNGVGDCKNRFVFSFLAYLLGQKIFKKIVVSFLMVGHTHEGESLARVIFVLTNNLFLCASLLV
jgi:hypothetical protein